MIPHRLLLFLSILSLLCTAVQAQPFGFGFKGGLNVASQYQEDLLSAFKYSNVAETGGFFLDMSLTDGWRLQPEAHFSVEGAGTRAFATNDGINGYYIELTDNFHYLKIPILAQRVFASGSSFKFILGAGMYGSVLLGGSSVVTGGVEDVQDLGPYADPIDLGILVNTGLELAGILLDVRYAVGLGGHQNRVFSLLAGYRIQ